MTSATKRILLIETSTSLCSVALAEGRSAKDVRVTACRESTTARSHAAMTAVYADEVLKEAGISVRDCDAVAVSSGPGSYTGLRVGSSTAKGLCFGAGIPLIAVPTLDILALQGAQYAAEQGLAVSRIIPAVDARRMEVYCAQYSPDGLERLSEVRPLVVEKDSFPADALIVGDGARKCAEITLSPFLETCPKASLCMARPAFEKFLRKEYENTAYFEPFYLKDFVATVSRKNLF